MHAEMARWRAEVMKDGDDLLQLTLIRLCSLKSYTACWLGAEVREKEEAMDLRTER